MTERQNILTPVGRIVAGNVFKGRTTDQKGNPLLTKSGPNAGKPRSEWFFAIAIAKTDPGWPEFYNTLMGVARLAFPTMFDANGVCTRSDFAFKITDGDSTQLNQKNKRPCDKEGYPGNWVVNFSGGFAPRVYARGGTELLTDPESVKAGYFVRVYVNVAGNETPENPGIYINPSMVEMIAYGDEIVVGPDGAAVFGGAPVANLPAGASATPIAPTTTLAAPGAPAPMGAPAATPAPVGAPVGAPPAAAAPLHQPPSPAAEIPMGATPPPTPAPDFMNVYTVEGQTYTKQQLLGFGWTEAQISGLTPNS